MSKTEHDILTVFCHLQKNNGIVNSFLNTPLFYISNCLPQPILSVPPRKVSTWQSKITWEEQSQLRSTRVILACGHVPWLLSDVRGTGPQWVVPFPWKMDCMRKLAEQEPVSKLMSRFLHSSCSATLAEKWVLWPEAILCRILSKPHSRFLLEFLPWLPSVTEPR